MEQRTISIIKTVLLVMLQCERLVLGFLEYIKELGLDTINYMNYVFDVWVPEVRDFYMSPRPVQLCCPWR